MPEVEIFAVSLFMRPVRQSSYCEGSKGDLECIPIDVCSGEGCVHCSPPEMKAPIGLDTNREIFVVLSRTKERQTPVSCRFRCMRRSNSYDIEFIACVESKRPVQLSC